MIVVVPPQEADMLPDVKSSAVSTPKDDSCARWQWASMPPGSTSFPEAARTSPDPSSASPIATIFPSLIPTSETRTSESVTTRPPCTMRSKSAKAQASRLAPSANVVAA